jgi:excisionase family DNA binding protein
VYSPQKAANVAGVSRKTIMNAIQAEKLNGYNNNRNRWMIKEEDLRAWMDARKVISVSSSTTNTLTYDSSIKDHEITTLQTELKASRDAIAEKDSTIVDLRIEGAELSAELKASRNTIAERDATIGDLKTDRSGWTALAERKSVDTQKSLIVVEQAQRLTEQALRAAEVSRKAETRAKRTFWQRLFGRS